MTKTRYALAATACAVVFGFSMGMFAAGDQDHGENSMLKKDDGQTVRWSRETIVVGRTYWIDHDHLGIDKGDGLEVLKVVVPPNRPERHPPDPLSSVVVPPLKSLEEHKREQREREAAWRRPSPTGVACPKCGAELLADNTRQPLVGNLRYANCPNGDWKGTL